MELVSLRRHGQRAHARVMLEESESVTFEEKEIQNVEERAIVTFEGW